MQVLVNLLVTAGRLGFEEAVGSNNSGCGFFGQTAWAGFNSSLLSCVILGEICALSVASLIRH